MKEAGRHRSEQILHAFPEHHVETGAIISDLRSEGSQTLPTFMAVLVIAIWDAIDVSMYKSDDGFSPRHSIVVFFFSVTFALADWYVAISGGKQAYHIIRVINKLSY